MDSTKALIHWSDFGIPKKNPSVTLWKECLHRFVFYPIVSRLKIYETVLNYLE